MRCGGGGGVRRRGGDGGGGGVVLFFFFNATATTEIYTLSLHDALPILAAPLVVCVWSLDIPLIKSTGPAAYPIRHPVIENVLDPALNVNVWS